jgi:hypothetical protein
MYSIIQVSAAIDHGLITSVLTGTIQAPTDQAGNAGNLIPALLIVAVVIALFLVPVAIYVFRRPAGPTRSLLLVSTDESARDMVIRASKRAGYRAQVAYRYEDGLDKLRRDTTIEMIMVDDSVPQYEAGLLLSALGRLTIGVRPLILIHDSSELGQTAPSYRAEALVARPLTEKALENAIRQVSDKIVPI